MGMWSRIANVFRSDRVNREIDEEFKSHVDEAIEQGGDPEEVRKAFGSTLRLREESRDARVLPRLDSLVSDAVFGWRQLKKHKIASIAAILSLGLGIGACTSAFRLIDAFLLRPLPVAHPERLYDVYRQEIGFDGKPGTFDGWAYPDFQLMRAVVKDEAELIAISYDERMELSYQSEQETEKAHVQYVSGWMFSAFGLGPVVGRLFVENDDLTPGAHPYAVISYDYWTHRFGNDPAVVGRRFQMNKRLYEIVGVAEERFTGTEPGTMMDIFLPAMMNSDVTQRDSTWHRTLAVLKPGAAVEPIREKLDAVSLAFERARAKGFTNMSRQSIENYLHQTVMLESAPAGVSGLQNDNRRSLAALGVIVGLVLLIACANVANLMTAEAAARAREMALRVSIGAGRRRLVQLVLVEAAWVALLAAVIGSLFAWWSAPIVVRMINPPDNPARLVLPADWRVLGFGVLLTLGVTLLFGLMPALRASAVSPIHAIKGGDNPRSRSRWMHALVAMQVVFCFLVLFAAGLFAKTFERLSHKPTGFSAERVLTLDTVAQQKQPAEFWYQVIDHLRSLPGVEKAALAGWPLLSGRSWNNSISVRGGPPSDDLTYFLKVSPDWLETMKIPLIDGRDFRWDDVYPGAAIVNETFAKRYFPGENPVGNAFDETKDEGGQNPMRIVGVVQDARYRGMRDAIPPVAYVPFRSAGGKGTDETTVRGMARGTFLVRTVGANPLAMAQILRQEIPRARPEFRVSNIRTQAEINDVLAIRERLLATLALFFAGVAVLLAGVGLYGVLYYSVVQRQREIGIRMAVGARAVHVAGRITREVFAMVFAGGVAGLAVGMVLVRFIAALFYEVKATDAGMVAIPTLTILVVALIAAVPAVWRAVRIDPVTMLRAE